MAWGDPGSFDRAIDRAVKGASVGGATGGLWTLPAGGLGAIPGAILGGLAGAIGWDGGGSSGKSSAAEITATPEQQAAFARERQLREDAVRQARGMGGAAARDAAQQGALAYGGAGMAPAGGGRLAGLRDIGQGAETARQQAALEASIFEQEASPEAAKRRNIAELTQMIESLRAANRLTPEAVRNLLPLATSQESVDFLNAQAASAPGMATAQSDLANFGAYFGIGEGK